MKGKLEIMSRLLEGQCALDLVAEQNGNHVVQKCIECIKPASALEPLIQACLHLDSLNRQTHYCSSDPANTAICEHAAALFLYQANCENATGRDESLPAQLLQLPMQFSLTKTSNWEDIKLEFEWWFQASATLN